MIPLHVHSRYSLLRGIPSPEQIVLFAKEYNLPAIALTDTNGMYGSIQFYKKAKEEGIKPILGVYIDDPADARTYAVFIPKTRAGYSLMTKIITSRQIKKDFSLHALLAAPLPEVVVITPSLSLIEVAHPSVELYAELIAQPSYKHSTRELYNHIKNKGIPFVASHPAYLVASNPVEYLLHKVVTAIRHKTTLALLDKRLLADEQASLPDPAVMSRLWKGLPEALANTYSIARSVNYDIELGKTKFPRFYAPSGESSYSYLWKLCFQGLSQRYPAFGEQAMKRLEYEVGIINELGFTDYFLVVWDIVREAKKRGMVTIGRGSAANSLVSYCLGFTDVDPIKYDLYFERFLNRGRSSPPDIDLDFSWKERDQIVKYVFDKYGYDRVAMISTTVTFRARSAFRETAKVFGIPDSEISEYSKFIPWTSAANLTRLADLFPESKSLTFNEEPWKSIVEVASRLAGFPRHLSIHPGGIVITPEPIVNYVALEYASNKGLGLIITQPDMYPIEDLGLIKIDLLSQRSLGVLRDTVQMITNNKYEGR